MQIGLGGLLTIIFVLCKIFDKVQWSWFWVFSPLWIGVALWLVVMLIALLGAGTAAALSSRKRRTRFW